MYIFITPLAQLISLICVDIIRIKHNILLTM